MAQLAEKGIAPPPRGIPNKADQWAWEVWFKQIADNLPKVRFFTIALDLPSVAANTVAEATVTVTGLTTSDIVFVNAAHQANLAVASARVTAADTLGLSLVNPTGGALDYGSVTFNLIAVRK